MWIYKIEGETTYAIQYHPWSHSTDGSQMLENLDCWGFQNFNGFVEEWWQRKEKVGNDVKSF
jgi:GMP synthase (glutamine-hydrolysing)